MNDDNVAANDRYSCEVTLELSKDSLAAITRAVKALASDAYYSCEFACTVLTCQAFRLVSLLRKSSGKCPLCNKYTKAMDDMLVGITRTLNRPDVDCKEYLGKCAVCAAVPDVIWQRLDPNNTGANCHTCSLNRNRKARKLTQIRLRNLVKMIDRLAMRGTELLVKHRPAYLAVKKGSVES